MNEQQKTIMQLQMYEESLKMLAERQKNLLERIHELYETLHTIDELEIGSSLISIGSGNFVHGKITDIKKILVGMGAGVAIEKTPEYAKEILKRRTSELEKTLSKISKQIQGATMKMQKLQEKLQVGIKSKKNI